MIYKYINRPVPLIVLFNASLTNCLGTGQKKLLNTDGYSVKFAHLITPQRKKKKGREILFFKKWPIKVKFHKWSIAEYIVYKELVILSNPCFLCFALYLSLEKPISMSSCSKGAFWNALCQPVLCTGACYSRDGVPACQEKIYYFVCDTN